MTALDLAVERGHEQLGLAIREAGGRSAAALVGDGTIGWQAGATGLQDGATGLQDAGTCVTSEDEPMCQSDHMGFPVESMSGDDADTAGQASVSQRASRPRRRGNRAGGGRNAPRHQQGNDERETTANHMVGRGTNKQTAASSARQGNDDDDRDDDRDSVCTAYIAGDGGLVNWCGDT